MWVGYKSEEGMCPTVNIFDSISKSNTSLYCFVIRAQTALWQLVLPESNSYQILLCLCQCLWLPIVTLNKKPKRDILYCMCFSTHWFLFHVCIMFLLFAPVLNFQGYQGTRKTILIIITSWSCGGIGFKFRCEVHYTKKFCA